VIYHVETEAGELFVLNTATLKWGIASTILSSPSIMAAEKNLAKFEFRAEGDLIPLGAGAYSLDGRIPKDGLSAVGILCVLFENTLVVYLRGNAKLKDGTFKSNPITKTEYVLMQDKQEEKPAVAVQE
jgi:hypothetical protein